MNNFDTVDYILVGVALDKFLLKLSVYISVDGG